MVRNARATTALKEMLWLSCLLWGFLLMISAAEGFPYTSIHIRGDLAQDLVGAPGSPLGCSAFTMAS